MSDKLFIAQPYQEGTSFSEITHSVEKCIARNKYGIELLKYPYSEEKKIEGSLENSEELFLHVNVIRDLVQRNFSHVLFLDFFTPGLDTLALAKDIKQTREKLGALLHGGTFLEGDIYQWEWLKKAEQVWFEIFDTIYVPSVFLKNQIPERHQDKIKVFPWGMDNVPVIKETIQWEKRNIDVIFPHRLDKDKGVEEFIDLMKSFPEYSFAVTIPQKDSSGEYFDAISRQHNCEVIAGENDKEHFETLQNSKVVLSTAYQENFGYSVLKSMCAGCVPLVPNRLVYPEFIPEQYRYDDAASAKKNLRQILDGAFKNHISLKQLEERIRSFTFDCIIRDFYEV